jgi:transcriptional regulator GlxA family with amidase domain
MVAEADAGRSPIGGGMMARQAESTILSGVLEAAPHDHSTQLGRHRDAPRQRHLRLAEAFVDARLDQPLTIEEIAQAAGVSPRALQLAFREHRGTTPLAFWRDRRLTRAHEDLLAGRGSVTEIALRWGFTHFGRFAEAYRDRYGLCPRDSLRAGRG